MLKRLGKAILLFLLLAAVCFSICWVTIFILGGKSAAEIRATTVPLSPEVALDLCQKLALPSEDARCQPGREVYAYQFFRDIRRPFRNGVTTYEDVQAVFGEYEFECEPRTTTADGYSYFRCRYDFTGDRVHWVMFRFSGEDDVLDQVITHDTWDQGF